MSRVPLLEMLGTDFIRTRDSLMLFDEYEFARSTDFQTRGVWWEAYSYYRAKTTDQSRQAWLNLKPGMILFVDNWRILHGRTDYKLEKAGQERVLHTAYFDVSHLQRRLLAPDSNFDQYLEKNI